MRFDQAMHAFGGAMMDKFIERIERYGEENSWTNGDPLRFKRWDVWTHFLDEVDELKANPRDEREMVDVANLAFMLWWHSQEGSRYAVQPALVAGEQG